MKENNLQTSLLFGIALLFVGQALQSSNGFLSAPALVFLTIALVFTILGCISTIASLPPVSQKELSLVLVFGLLLQIFQLLIARPFSILPDLVSQLWVFRAIIGVGVGAAFLSLVPKFWAQLQVRRVLILISFGAIFSAGVWVIRSSPQPFIDVYMFQTTSSQALIRGQNPYELTESLLYEDARLYGPELVKDGRMTIGNPYPPLSIYLSTLGYVIGGDIRYSQLVAILLTAAMIAGFGSNRVSLLASYLFLFTPRLFYVLDFSWTEPLILFFVAATIWFAIHRPAWTFIAFGLLIASKQYMVAMLPLMILLFPAGASLRDRIKAVGQALGVAFLVTAPMAFWNIQAFMWNVVSAQFYQPFRPDALSYAVIYNLFTDQIPPFYLPFLLLGVTLLLVLRFGPRSPLGFASGAALCLFVFFATNKQAFCNYYFLVLGILACALALSFVRQPGDQADKLVVQMDQAR